MILLAVLLAAGAAGSGASPAATAMADYATIPLDRLIGTAQLIVAGEVTALRERTVTLRVASTLAGDAPSGTIEVIQYVPSKFEGAPRSSPYRAGQSFLLFLVRDEKQSDSAWRILGAGGEGEMPLDEGFVYFHGRHVEGLAASTYRVHGSERKIQRTDAKTFCDAVEGYRECFRWKPGSTESTPPERLCGGEALDRYARTSEIHRHLAQLTAKRLKR
jgi:hypothetical protein